MRFAPLLLAVLPVLAVPASGQALKGHNSNAPVDVSADRIEVQDRADRAMFVGNVRAVQSGLTMTAQRVTIAYDSSGSGTSINRMDATGGVTVTSADQTARGQIAIYDLPRRLITMLGGVTLTQGQSRVSGGRLVIDLNTGRAVVDGRAAGAPGTSGGEGGRVTGRFTVTQKPN